jgi:hypothetical protein
MRSFPNTAASVPLALSFLLLERCLFPREMRQAAAACAISALDCFSDWTETPRVGGSIPPLATIENKNLGAKSKAFPHGINPCLWNKRDVKSMGWYLEQRPAHPVSVR